MTAEVKPTNCHYCGYCCAFLATVEDGRVTDLVPDPSRYPYDERILAGCRRWPTSTARRRSRAPSAARMPRSGRCTAS